MMELCHITAGYGGPPVLRDVSLAFEPGKVTVLAGPNGCGKSTLLRVAARLMAPERGEVRIEGQDVSRLSAKQFARLAALLPQSRPLPGITAGSLVLHGRFPYLGYPRRYSREGPGGGPPSHGAHRCGRAGGVPMAHLSGGQRQKVYLAMALAQDTPVLLLDEPTTFLDIAHQLELAETARTLAGEGKAVVMVLHDLNLAPELRTPGGGAGGGTAAAGGCAGGDLRLRRAGEGIPGPGPQRGDGEGGAAVPLQPAVRAEGGHPARFLV